eukprot:scaffold435472_cov22-Prasinocladus_malaysianus.AAC.1
MPAPHTGLLLSACISSKDLITSQPSPDCRCISLPLHRGCYLLDSDHCCILLAQGKTRHSREHDLRECLGLCASCTARLLLQRKYRTRGEMRHRGEGLEPLHGPFIAMIGSLKSELAWARKSRHSDW